MDDDFDEMVKLAVSVLLQYRHRYFRMTDKGVAKLHAALPVITHHRTADLLIQRILDQCPPRCAWMAAMMYGRVRTLYRLAPDVARKISIAFLEPTIDYLAHRKKWTAIISLMDLKPYLTESMVYLKVVHRALEDDPGGLTVFQQLLAHYSRHIPNGVKEIVLNVCMKGFSGQFGVLLNSTDVFIRQVIFENIKSFVFEACRRRLQRSQWCESPANCNGCFEAASKAGIFTAINSDTATELMVHVASANQPDLVLFLYHAAILTHSHIFQMLQAPSIQQLGSEDPAITWKLSGLGIVPFDDEARETAANIKRFLEKKASNPSSLLTLCLRQVSTEIGWGRGREMRIRELEIPETLKEDLCFLGLEKVLKQQPS